MHPPDGRTALVTGGSRGIGRAIASRLAADGFVVAVHYGSDAAAADEVVTAIRTGGGRAFAAGADLGELAAIDGLLDAVARGLREHGGDGRIDVLVNNAGIGWSRGLHDVDQAEFDRLVAVNVRAPLFLVQRALPRLRDGGRIVNVSSGVVRVAVPEILPYAMTKGALDVLTRTLAKELGGRGITVNGVAPGVIETDVTAAWLSTPAGRAEVAAKAALGRVGQPEDVAGVVAMLVSDAGAWITGTTIDASGGQHL